MNTTNRSQGPANNLTDPMLEKAIAEIENAIKDHCNGGDLWMAAAIAAQRIIGDIAQVARHRYSGCPPGQWKRMPPELREAIAAATGQPADNREIVK